jgi:hypothetical protein
MQAPTQERHNGFAGLALNGPIDSYWSLAVCGSETACLHRSSSGWFCAGMYGELARAYERGCGRTEKA